MKSARVRQPSTKGFSPMAWLRSFNLGRYFSRTPALAVSCSLFQNSPRMAPAASLKIERKTSTLAWSLTSFPRSSLLPQRWMMQRWTADDSVTLNSPSRRQGMLGKLRPRLTLSSPNQRGASVYCLSSNSTPTWLRRSLGTWANPLIPQQPSLTLLYLIWGCMGVNGSTTASGLVQQASIPGSCSKLCLILNRNLYSLLRSGLTDSRQQALSARMKSTRVRQPRANSLSPTKFLRYSSLGLTFSKAAALTSALASAPKAGQSSLKRSAITPRMLLTDASSWTVLPRSSW